MNTAMSTPVNTMAHKIAYKIKVFFSASTLAMLTLYAPINYAGPGNLADTPLFLANSVQPNIAFMIDDSGSMGAENLLNAGTFSPGSTIGDDVNVAGVSLPRENLDITPDTPIERLMVCRGFNIQAYDHTVQYTPWSGTDSNGEAYSNLTLTTARFNPYNPENRNITNHVYFEWNDIDEDRAYDGPGGGPNTGAAECGDIFAESNTGGVAVNNTNVLSPAEQQNYANWWSYYRKREYIVKRALSQIIVESSARMGLGVINDDGSSSDPGGVQDSDSAQVLDINNISLPVNPTAQTNKNNLLTNLFTIGSAGATPLRTGLERVGDYFEGNNSNWGNSPILNAAQGGECQHNFGIIMSDGFWSGGSPSVGNTDADSSNGFDGGSYADANDDIANTLADVAMHFYERDLNSSLANNVPRAPLDPNPTGLPDNTMHQHMKTFTVAFGLNGTLSGNPPNGTGWPTPIENQLTTVDDMRHAAWNGRGEFLNAGNPQQLINGLNSVIGSISAITGSAAAVTFNTSSLSTNSEIYLALFNSDSWSGDLLSFALDPVSGDISNTPTWSASTVLTDRILSNAPRTILTYSATTNDGIPFQWANLDIAQKNDLRTNADGSPPNDATARARLEYLRGDRSCEANSTGNACSVTEGGDDYDDKNLRDRNSRLGDIVHSGPVFVGAPNFNWPDTLHQSFGTTPYSNFRVAEANRSGIVYVGSNDGMLHGFAENSGEELLAYVPGFLSSTAVDEGLHYLTYQQYAHQYYVDLTPSIADVYIESYVGDDAGWKTILVGGARSGGRGIFALDITEPTFSETTPAPANTVLWEFSSADDPDLGFTFSQPSIVPLDNGQWAAIFGNGYNDSGSGQAALFIVFLEGGIDGAWTINSDYIKISTGVGSTIDRNGLASPAVIDSDGNGTADRVYAGDLEGNMWAFDISGSNTNLWGVAYEQGGTPKELFSAPDNSPITTAPVIVRNPDIPTSGREPNTLVLFGTGQYLTTADITTTAPLQAFYGVWDNGSDQQLMQNDLVEQIIDTDTTLDGTPARTLTSNPVSYADDDNGEHDNGWFMTLPVAGERSVTNAIVRGERVIFVTTIPDGDPCGSGGNSFLMVADFNDGSSPDEAAFDINGDGVIDSGDEINGNGAAGTAISGIGTSPASQANLVAIATTDTSGSGTSPNDIIDSFEFEDLGGLNAGRLSWEELAR
ncbi:MAG: hypothetical protein JKY90_02140 [Gammaproteobacteria bacterium]|nr:hypothetical protein [Gammaproteobacteria bacterium]